MFGRLMRLLGVGKQTSKTQETSPNGKPKGKTKYLFSKEKELNNLGHLMTTATILAGLFVAGALLVIEAAPDYSHISNNQIIIDDPNVFYYEWLESVPDLMDVFEEYLPTYFEFLLLVFTFAFLVAFLATVMFLLASYDIDRPHEYMGWKKHGTLLLTICVILSTLFLPYSILRFSTKWPSQWVILFVALLILVIIFQRFYWRIRGTRHRPEDFEIVD
ncbi:MAG: hypothetical protein ACXACI_04020 [Candidatus Hodarchaeales archaeon]|jgi:SNF family Na+-dependent transporter